MILQRMRVLLDEDFRNLSARKPFDNGDDMCEPGHMVSESFLITLCPSRRSGIVRARRNSGELKLCFPLSYVLCKNH